MSFWFSKPPAATQVISQEPAEEDKAHDIINYAKDYITKGTEFSIYLHKYHMKI